MPTGGRSSALSDLGEWQSALNARLYDEYARTHWMYQETSASLVDALSLHSVARAVDLACGSGVTTEALLRRVDGDGVIYGVDGSQAMLDVAMRRLRDERVRWRCADALDVESVVGESCDVVVCNSAIWQLGGLSVFARIRGVLREGGEFVFNCWAIPPRSSEAPRSASSERRSLVTAVRRIAAAEYGWVAPKLPPPKPDEFPLRDLVTDDLVGIVEGAGFDVVERWWFAESSGLPGAGEAWLRIPVMTEWYLPGVPYELRMEILEKAAEELGLVGDGVEEPSRPAHTIPDGESGSGVGWFCVRAVAR